MGTFRIITPTSIGTNTIHETLDGINFGTSDPELIAGIIADGTTNNLVLGHVSLDAVSGTIHFNFDQNNPIISLDGNAPVSFNSLPAGFTPLTAGFSLLACSFDASQIFLHLQGFSDEGPAIIPPVCGSPGIVSLNYSSSSPPTMLSIIDNGFGIRVAFNSIGSQNWCYKFSFIGTYGIQQFKFTLQPSPPVKPGDHVVITSDPVDPKHLNLKDITEVDIVPVDPDDPTDIPIKITKFLVQTEFYLEFILPSFFLNKKPKQVEIELIGNGVQFSGSVSAGFLDTIYFTAASGIYVLSSGKTSDTLYNRNLVFPVVTPRLELMSLFGDDNIEYQTYYLLKQNIIINDTYGEIELDSAESEDDLFITTSVDVIGSSEFNIPNPFIKTSFVP